MAEARFRVNRLLGVKGRAGFLVCGDVVRGRIAVGMSVLWPLYGDALTVGTPITRMDYVDSERFAGRTELALGIRFEAGAGQGESLPRDLIEAGLVVDVVRTERVASPTAPTAHADDASVPRRRKAGRPSGERS